jgi:pimeloyl-ACP methyl ester carboxylesterase/DNA-binding CsgD family transcriptional regulator
MAATARTRDADRNGAKMLRRSPTVRYAKGSNGWIAYEVMGTGPTDVVLLPGPLSHLDLLWDEPSCAAFLRDLATFCRLIIFDSSGTGLSDPVSDGILTPEQTADDFHAVMNASETERAAIFGISGGGSLATLIATTHPDRATALILYGSYPKLSSGPDYPWGSSTERPAEDVALKPDYRSHNWQNPTVHDDPRVGEWSERFFRSAGSPGVIRDVIAMMRNLDVRPILHCITTPTLVIARKNDAVISIDNSRYLAAHIPHAQLIELDGVDHHPWYGNADTVIDTIHHFLTDAIPHITQRTQRTRGTPSTRLTRREREVITLIHAGLTAREVAKRLVISERTVETHIAHAYTKLGINSRHELHRLTSAASLLEFPHPA